MWNHRLYQCSTGSLHKVHHMKARSDTMSSFTEVPSVDFADIKQAGPTAEISKAFFPRCCIPFNLVPSDYQQHV